MIFQRQIFLVYQLILLDHFHSQIQIIETERIILVHQHFLVNQTILAHHFSFPNQHISPNQMIFQDLYLSLFVETLVKQIVVPNLFILQIL